MVDRYFVLELPLLSLRSFLGFSRSRSRSRFLSPSLSTGLFDVFLHDDFKRIWHPSSPHERTPECSLMTSSVGLEQLEPALIRIPVKRFLLDSHTNLTSPLYRSRILSRNRTVCGACSPLRSVGKSFPGSLAN